MLELNLPLWQRDPPLELKLLKDSQRREMAEAARERPRAVAPPLQPRRPCVRRARGQQRLLLTRAEGLAKYRWTRDRIGLPPACAPTAKLLLACRCSGV